MGTKPELYHLPGFYEPFSAMSHLLGAFVFLFLGCVLILRGRNNPAGLPYLVVYAVSVVVLMFTSSLFHMVVRGSPPHVIIERLDHAAIFILIAGTFTPSLGVLFQGWWRWLPLVIIWTAAIVGITLKTIFFDDFADEYGLALYLGMGWFGSYSGVLLAWRYGFNFVKPLVFGGIAYSIGGVIDLMRSWTLIPGVIHMHELFHITVLMGAFWHWLFIWQFANGAPPLRSRAKSEIGQAAAAP